MSLAVETRKTTAVTALITAMNRKILNVLAVVAVATWAWTTFFGHMTIPSVLTANSPVGAPAIQMAPSPDGMPTVQTVQYPILVTGSFN